MKRKRDKQRRKMAWWMTSNEQCAAMILNRSYPEWLARLMGWWS